MKKETTVIILMLVMAGCSSGVEYRGGYIQVETVDSAPEDVTVVDPTETDLLSNPLLRDAVTEPYENIALEDRSAYDSVQSILPQRAYYDGTAAPTGYYFEYEGQIVVLRLVELV
jgi:hypothetical protein